MKWLLLSIPAVLIILLLIPVEFRISYVFKDGRNSLSISTSYLFGLIKPELVPFNSESKDKNKIRGKGDNSKSKKESRPKGVKKIGEYIEPIDYLVKKMTVKEIMWETKIGLSEPHYLSILYGFLWWIKSIIIGFLLSKKEVDNLKINVLPVYNENKFGSQFNCIIKLRMVYIINIWIWLIKLYKGGEEYDRPSNRRLNENYNE